MADTDFPIDSSRASSQAPRVSRFQTAGFEPLNLVSRVPLFELWRVRDRQTGLMLLWKQPRPEWDDSPTVRQMLGHEERISLQLNSPRIVPVLAPSEHPAPAYLLLGDCDGTSLQVAINRRGAFSLGSTLWIARQTAEALRDFQRSGFLHSDLHPGNLLVHRTGQIQLTGLSLARQYPRPLPLDLSSLESVMEPEIQQYRAPERALSFQTPRIAWDLYSLGTLMYRLLTGKLPWAGESAVEISKLQGSSQPAPLRQWVPQVPRDVAELVEGLLSRQPLRRPDSWQQVVEQLIALELRHLEPAGALSLKAS